MRRRPTRKAASVSAVGAILVVVGSTAQSGWLFVLAAGVLGLVVSGILASHRLASCSVVRSLPDRARVGDTVTVDYRIHNSSRKRLPVMRIQDRFPAFGDVVLASESIPAGGIATAELEVPVVARGIFEDGEAELVTGAPFGFVRSRRREPVASRMIVHPAWTDLSGLELIDNPVAATDETHATARTGHGDVFVGIRDYRAGDLQRWIHWRSTARTGRLVVREHEEPARSPVVLVLGAGRGDEAWETLVSACASIGAAALQGGRTVHLARPGAPDSHDATRTRMLDWLAGADPQGKSIAEAVEAAAGRWGPRCSFVLFAQAGAPDGRDLLESALSLRSRGGAVSVVCAGHGPVIADDLAVHELRRAGVPLITVDPGDDLESSLAS